MASTYIRHKPSPPLNAYIDHLYYLDGQMPFRHEKILPKKRCKAPVFRQVDIRRKVVMRRKGV